MSTRYNLPLSSLPEEFFVEELRYRDKKKLEALLATPKPKIEGATVPLYLKDYTLTNEEYEQIEAYAPRAALIKAIALAEYHDQWETIQ